MTLRFLRLNDYIKCSITWLLLISIMLLSPLAIALNNEAKDAYTRGVKAKKAQAWRKAENHFHKALKLEPSWSKPLEAIIRLRLDGRLSQTPLRHELTRYAELRPKSYKIWLFEGRYAHQLGDYPRALNAYSKVLEMRPKTLSAMLHRADLQLHLGEPAKALTDYQVVLNLRENHTEARWGKLLALIQLKEWVTAHQIANEIALQDPDNMALWNLRNLASRYSGLPPPRPKTLHRRNLRELPHSNDVELTE